MGTPIRLVDETGIERFRGTQSPGGGSSPFTGWTEDGSNPANVDSNGGGLQVGDLSATIVAAPSFLAGASGLAGTLTLYDGVAVEQIVVGAVAFDPSAGAGVAATPGSLLLRSNGQAWLKTGAADTDWSQLSAPAPPPTESLSALAANPVANDTTVNAAVQHTTGDALLDYTDPTAPTVLATGLYAVTLLAQCFEGPQPGGIWNAGITLTNSGPVTTQAAQDGPLTAGGGIAAPSITVTAIGPLTAGDTITFQMTSYSGAMGTLNLNVTAATVAKLA